jgi:hypothetical protein
MSFSSLLNKRCSWKRRMNAGIDSFGEITLSEVTIGSDVRCSRQVGLGYNSREKINTEKPGDTVKGLVKYYLLPTDIQEDDLITFEGSETEEVRYVRDAAGRGHHLEVLAVMINPTGEADKRVG